MFMFEDRQGHVSCIDAATGKVIWFKPRVGADVLRLTGAGRRQVFCVDTAGTVICLAADKEFKELGRTKLRELSRSTPAIANGANVRADGVAPAVSGGKNSRSRIASTNANLEIRSSKYETNQSTEWEMTEAGLSWLWGFEFWSFVLVSDLMLRISSLPRRWLRRGLRRLRLRLTRAEEPIEPLAKLAGNEALASLQFFIEQSLGRLELLSDHPLNRGAGDLAPQVL